MRRADKSRLATVAALVGFIFVGLALRSRFPSRAVPLEIATLLHRQLPMDNAQRNVTYEQVLSELYRPLGYSLRVPRDDDSALRCPFLPLNLPRRTCPQVFQAWLAHNVRHASKAPPKWAELRAEDKTRFLMAGLAALDDWYIGNEANNADPNHVLTIGLDTMTSYKKELEAGHRTFGAYGAQSASLYHAMARHRPGARGMTIGTIVPWAESMALHLGAKHITIAEYQILRIDKQLEGLRLSWAHPMDVAGNASAYGDLDWVASFSSLEHSGLGRYGDVLDPIGDIREAHKVHCLLKPGGLFYLGLPTARTDTVAWNAHRIYSMVRWPLMGAGFRVIDVFLQDAAEPTTFAAASANHPNQHIQPTIVLQKIETLEA